MTVQVRLLLPGTPRGCCCKAWGNRCQAVTGGCGRGYAPAGCPGTTRDIAGKLGNVSADAPERRVLEPLRGHDTGPDAPKW